MSQAEWRRALDVKAEVIRASKVVTDSSHYVAMGDYIEAQLAKPGTPRALMSSIIGADPIWLTSAVQDQLRRRVMTMPALSDLNGSGTITIRGSHAEMYQSWLIGMRMPVDNPPMKTGIIVLEEPWLIQSTIDTVQVDAIYFTQEDILQENRRGLRLIVYAHPDSTPFTGFKVRSLQPIVLPMWGAGYTFSREVAKIEERWREVLDDGLTSPTAFISAILSDGMFYAACMAMVASFLQYASEYVDAIEKADLDKSSRGYAQKKNVSPRVQIVHWRREESPPPPEQDVRYEPALIEWQCHWKVREHTRTYKKTGKTITIKSYKKGPLDKPFKGPNTIIHVADR